MLFRPERVVSRHALLYYVSAFALSVFSLTDFGDGYSSGSFDGGSLAVDDIKLYF